MLGLYQLLLITQSMWKPQSYGWNLVFLQHERETWHYFRGKNKINMRISRFTGWEGGNSQEQHVCVLPLQHDRALISFHSTCCSTFFLNVGWTFLLALKLKVQEEISDRFENTPHDEPGDEEGCRSDPAALRSCRVLMRLCCWWSEAASLDACLHLLLP